MDRRSWTQQEDLAIRVLVQQFGVLDWTNISQKLKERYQIKERTGKQCRQRWYNHLNPEVNKKPWTNEEQNQLFQIHRKSGNKWKLMSKYFEGRTDNDIKNHFYSTLRRSLRRLNKFIGQKNSTTQMREIKPSVLSTIMNYIYQQESHIESNIVNSLKDLPYLIFQFSNYKPVKSKLKVEQDQKMKDKINFIFSLINKANSTYQNIKHVNRTQKKKNNQLTSLQDDDSKKEKSQEVDFIKYLPKKSYTSITPDEMCLTKKPKEKLPAFKKSDYSQIKPDDYHKQNYEKDLMQTDLMQTDLIHQDLQHHSDFLTKRQYESQFGNSNQKRNQQMPNLQEMGLLRTRRISLEAYEDFMEDESIGDVQQPSQASGFYCPGVGLQDLIIVGKQIPIRPYYSCEVLPQVEVKMEHYSQNQIIDELIEINYSN